MSVQLVVFPVLTTSHDFSTTFFSNLERLFHSQSLESLDRVRIVSHILMLSLPTFMKTHSTASLILIHNIHRFLYHNHSMYF